MVQNDQGYLYQERSLANQAAARDLLNAESSRLLTPAGVKSTAVLLDRLFAVLPLPNPDGIHIWIEMLSQYPGDVVRRAIDQVIKFHKWATPPTIAEVIEAVEEDFEYQQRVKALLAVKYIDGKLAQLECHKEQQRKLTAQCDAAREEARRKRVEAEMAPQADDPPSSTVESTDA